MSGYSFILFFSLLPGAREGLSFFLINPPPPPPRSLPLFVDDDDNDDDDGDDGDDGDAACM